MRLIVLVAVLVTVGLALTGSGGAATTDLICGTTITSSVALTHDVTCPGDGIEIDGGNPPLVINLNGHTLKGSGGSTFGIWVSGGSNVTIENGTISGFGSGIDAEGSNNVKIGNIRASKDGDGIDVFDRAYYTVIQNSIITENSGDGVNVSLYSYSITITGSTITRNAGHGYYANTSDGSFLTGNTILYNGAQGIYLWDSYSRLTGNFISWNALDGIYITDYLPVPGVDILTSNHAEHNGGYGMVVGIPDEALPAADGGGNTASNNALSPQCLGIFCAT